MSASAAAAGGAELDSVLEALRREIEPGAAGGRYARRRWAVASAFLALFYGLPWLTWNERQAVLLDLSGRKLQIFGLVLWPQDVLYFLALLAAAAALALLLLTTVAGRLWCGYACPQTVYSALFSWIQARIEGDRAARAQGGARPWATRSLARRAAKHAAWAAVAAWTGLTFVGYFTPIRELLADAARFALGPWETFWWAFYGLATYGNAGWLRERVCVELCPYAKLQGALVDADTLTIVYDARRGEPRGARAPGERPAGLGDCVACGLCVQACPTGIDIRRGRRYECIGCAACSDACDRVMERMGYPKGLIRYSTENAIAGHGAVAGWARPWPLALAALLLVATGGFAALASTRPPLGLDIAPERAPLVRVTAEGLLENAYRLRLMNAQPSARRYRLSVSGLPGVEIVARQPLEAPPAATVDVPVVLRIDAAGLPRGFHPLVFQVEDIEEPQIAARGRSRFYVGPVETER